MNAPHILPLGESALLVRLGDTLDLHLNHRARALGERIGQERIPGLTDVVPANSSVGVYFTDPAAAAAGKKILSTIMEFPDGQSVVPSMTVHEVPVAYNGTDLGEVANTCGLAVAEVIEMHSRRAYNVFAVGFAPGFAYLGELDERLSVPRRSQPRTRVPAGSVAIANRQTAIYPVSTPGGWQIIGTTSLPVFDVAREPAALFQVGDTVRFIPQ